MAAYVSAENGRYPDGVVRHMLTVSGQLINVGSANFIGRIVRQVMQPGDTYQETYERGGSSPVISYDEMVKQWHETDEFLQEG